MQALISRLPRRIARLRRAAQASFGAARRWRYHTPGPQLCPYRPRHPGTSRTAPGNRGHPGPWRAHAPGSQSHSGPPRWWPDGLYTAPTDEALVYDIQKTKDLGFNMIRKHIKIVYIHRARISFHRREHVCRISSVSSGFS